MIVQGDDDLGLKAELVREMLAKLPQEEVIAVLPERVFKKFQLWGNLWA